MKTIGLLLVAATSLSAPAQELETDRVCQNKRMVLNGFTKHFSTPTQYAQTYGYNEKNYGLGFSCGLSNLYRFERDGEVGFLKNSYRAHSWYASYGLRYALTEQFSVGGKFIVASGYKILKKNHGYKFGPMLTSNYKLTDHVILNFSVAPKVSARNAGFAMVSLGLGF